MSALCSSHPHLRWINTPVTLSSSDTDHTFHSLTPDMFRRPQARPGGRKAGWLSLTPRTSTVQYEHISPRLLTAGACCLCVWLGCSVAQQQLSSLKLWFCCKSWAVWWNSLFVIRRTFSASPMQWQWPVSANCLRLWGSEHFSHNDSRSIDI